MLELTDKAKDELHRELYLVNCKTAQIQLAHDIMRKLKYKRKGEKNVSQKNN